MFVSMTEYAYEVLHYFAEQDRPLSSSELRSVFSEDDLDDAIASLKSNDYIKERPLFTYTITVYGKNHLKVLRKSRIPITIRAKPHTAKSSSWFDNTINRWAAIVTIILGAIALFQLAFTSC
jgi:transposase-like protein